MFVCSYLQCQVLLIGDNAIFLTFITLSFLLKGQTTLSINAETLLHMLMSATLALQFFDFHELRPIKKSTSLRNAQR